MTVDLNLYKIFVEKITSENSNNLDLLINRMKELSNLDPTLNVSLLITGGIGLSSESGEFNELVKKILFQGKGWNEDTKLWMMKELGDCFWYLITACRAIGVDPNEVIAENVRKLESRYPGGSFDVHYSENRKDTDL